MDRNPITSPNINIIYHKHELSLISGRMEMGKEKLKEEDREDFKKGKLCEVHKSIPQSDCQVHVLQASVSSKGLDRPGFHIYGEM